MESPKRIICGLLLNVTSISNPHTFLRDPSSTNKILQNCTPAIRQLRSCPSFKIPLAPTGATSLLSPNQSLFSDSESRGLEGKRIDPRKSTRQLTQRLLHVAICNTSAVSSETKQVEEDKTLRQSNVALSSSDVEHRNDNGRSLTRIATHSQRTHAGASPWIRQTESGRGRHDSACSWI